MDDSATAEVQSAATSPGLAGDAVAHGRATLRAVVAILNYQGYAFSLLGVAAPFIAKGFGLDQRGIDQPDALDQAAIRR